MKFELPKLNYAYDALEPNIDARTITNTSIACDKDFSSGKTNGVAGRRHIIRKATRVHITVNGS